MFSLTQFSVKMGDTSLWMTYWVQKQMEQTIPSKDTQTKENAPLFSQYSTCEKCWLNAPMRQVCNVEGAVLLFQADKKGEIRSAISYQRHIVHLWSSTAGSRTAWVSQRSLYKRIIMWWVHWETVLYSEIFSYMYLLCWWCRFCSKRQVPSVQCLQGQARDQESIDILLCIVLFLQLCV